MASCKAIIAASRLPLSSNQAARGSGGFSSPASPPCSVVFRPKRGPRVSRLSTAVRADANSVEDGRDENKTSYSAPLATNYRGPGAGAVDCGFKKFSADFTPFDAFAMTRSMKHAVMAMDRLLEDALIHPWRAGEARPPWDIMEHDHVIKMRFDMPGISKDNVEVSVVNCDTLVVKGELASNEKYREGEQGAWFSKSYGSYHTSVLLPEGCDVNKISASFDNCVLLVTVPRVNKEEYCKPFKVFVN